MNANEIHPDCCACFECDDERVVPLVKPFKSERAAKMAYTKADHAWKAKQSEGYAARDAWREVCRVGGSMSCEEYDALRATEKRCEGEASFLFETMRAIYNQAKAQKFYINSWHFGYNATRDLIAANMD